LKKIKNNDAVEDYLQMRKKIEIRKWEREYYLQTGKLIDIADKIVLNVGF
jgi:hypothetical protein